MEFVKHHLKPLDHAGAPREHPWIRKLLDVSSRGVDPLELLKIYKEDPGSLQIADLKHPNHYWMPPETEWTAPLEALSRCAAMRALVGKRNWKSPALQALQKRTAQVKLPSNRPSVKDDPEGFYSYIRERLSGKVGMEVCLLTPLYDTIHATCSQSVGESDKTKYCWKGTLQRSTYPGQH